MKLSFVGAALLISVLSTDAQNHIPNLPPPPPPPLPPGYSGSQGYSVSANYNPQLPDPMPHSSPGSAQASYSGPAEYPNSPYPPPWFPTDFDSADHFRPEKLMQLFSKFVKFLKKQGNRKRHWRRRQRHPGRHRSLSFDPSNNPAPPQDFSGPPQGFSGPPQGFSSPPQGYFGAPQGYFGPPQGYFGVPQGYFGPPQGYFGAPQGFSGPPQGYYGPPQGYPVAGTTQQSSSFPAQPPGSAVPPSSGTPPPPASVPSGVKLPGNSTLLASGEPGSAPGNSGEKTSASKGQEIIIKASQ